MAKFCPNCGAGLVDAAKFCPACGAQIPATPVQQPYIQPQSPAPQPPPVKKKSKALFIALGAAALVIVLIVVIAVLGKGDGSGASYPNESRTTAQPGMKGGIDPALVGAWEMTSTNMASNIEFKPDGTYYSAVVRYSYGTYYGTHVRGNYAAEDGVYTLTNLETISGERKDAPAPLEKQRWIWKDEWRTMSTVTQEFHYAIETDENGGYLVRNEDGPLNADDYYSKWRMLTDPARGDTTTQPPATSRTAVATTSVKPTTSKPASSSNSDKLSGKWEFASQYYYYFFDDGSFKYLTAWPASVIEGRYTASNGSIHLTDLVNINFEGSRYKDLHHEYSFENDALGAYLLIPQLEQIPAEASEEPSYRPVRFIRSE
jgi:hypothetical protein